MNWPCAAVYRAELAPRTTLRVGGRVEWLLEPAHPDELVEGWRAALERGLRPRILGGGANLIIDDGLLPGVVVTTERMARVFRPPLEASSREALSERELPPLVPGEGAEDPRLVCWGGAPMPGLVRTARDLGWEGLAGLVGVPGHIGGGVAMNAGGRWGELWDVIEEVRLLTPAGELLHRSRHECRPSYRDGGLDGAVVLGVVLKLAPGNKHAIAEEMRQYLSEKSAAQPVTERSCGCIFKNPDRELSGGLSAGQLVEQVGAKGMSRGAARISEKHGNFLVNSGGARAAEVFELIDEVERLVLDETGVELVREAKSWRNLSPDLCP